MPHHTITLPKSLRITSSRTRIREYNTICSFCHAIVGTLCLQEPQDLRSELFLTILTVRQWPLPTFPICSLVLLFYVVSFRAHATFRLRRSEQKSEYGSHSLLRPIKKNKKKKAISSKTDRLLFFFLNASLIFIGFFHILVFVIAKYSSCTHVSGK